ncbi:MULTISPECIES: hypothetical protein [Enterobacterales]|uniref:hypothetical protein n=1 Tax=Enterobacterales TaxID=91347 RepID=UPI002ED85B6D
MNKTLLAVILMCCVICSAVLSFSLVREHKITHMRCTTYNTVVIGSQISSLRFDIVADGDSGITNIDGFYMNDSGVRIPVRAAHAFDMKHSGNTYTFSHKTLSTLAGNEATSEQIKRVLPEYMTKQGAAIKLTRYQQGKRGYILSTGSMVAYCKQPNEGR